MSHRIDRLCSRAEASRTMPAAAEDDEFEPIMRSGAEQQQQPGHDSPQASSSVFSHGDSDMPEVPLLPEGPVAGTAWAVSYDEDDGMPYYYNSETEESVWEMPPEVATATQPAARRPAPPEQKRAAVPRSRSPVAERRSAAPTRGEPGSPRLGVFNKRHGQAERAAELTRAQRENMLRVDEVEDGAAAARVGAGATRVGVGAASAPGAPVTGGSATVEPVGHRQQAAVQELRSSSASGAQQDAPPASPSRRENGAGGARRSKVLKAAPPEGLDDSAYAMLEEFKEVQVSRAWQSSPPSRRPVQFLQAAHSCRVRSSCWGTTGRRCGMRLPCHLTTYSASISGRCGTSTAGRTGRSSRPPSAQPAMPTFSRRAAAGRRARASRSGSTRSSGSSSRPWRGRLHRPPRAGWRQRRRRVTAGSTGSSRTWMRRYRPHGCTGPTGPGALLY